jgi:hypothetical protein
MRLRLPRELPVFQPFVPAKAGHPVAATAHEEPFQAVPAGQADVTDALAVVEPQALLAVMMQFVEPGAVLPREPAPPLAGDKLLFAELAPLHWKVADTALPLVLQVTV